MKRPRYMEFLGPKQDRYLVILCWPLLMFSTHCPLAARHIYFGTAHRLPPRTGRSQPGSLEALNIAMGLIIFRSLLVLSSHNDNFHSRTEQAAAQSHMRGGTSGDMSQRTPASGKRHLK